MPSSLKLITFHVEDFRHCLLYLVMQYAYFLCLDYIVYRISITFSFSASLCSFVTLSSSYILCLSLLPSVFTLISLIYSIFIQLSVGDSKQKIIYMPGPVESLI